MVELQKAKGKACVDEHYLKYTASRDQISSIFDKLPLFCIIM